MFEKESGEEVGDRLRAPESDNDEEEEESEEEEEIFEVKPSKKEQ